MNIGLKNAWSQSFKIGTAVCLKNLNNEKAGALVQKHFSSLTAENAMKFEEIHPEENVYNWEETDFLANYARKNGLVMRGHTFVWHNQNPDWLFKEGSGDVSKNTLYKRLETHIETVTNRYNDIVYAWDVLNEIFDTDNGDDKGFRITDWYKICGKEVYEYAFKLARQFSPNAKLFYNDYNNEAGEKMEVTIRFLSELQDAGIPVDGVGLQGHWYYNYPDEKTLRTAFERYSALGLDIELTEVDVSVYEWDEAKEKAGFFTARPEDRILEQAQRYKEIFTIASEYPAVKNITMWGIADNYTWLDNFPVKGRKNWPLLFDENLNEKPCTAELIRR